MTTETKLLCGQCMYAVDYAETGDMSPERVSALNDNLPGMWNLDTSYMLDDCREDPRWACGPCQSGREADHEYWSEASPLFECEGCGDRPGVFAEVYRAVHGHTL